MLNAIGMIQEPDVPNAEPLPVATRWRALTRAYHRLAIADAGSDAGERHMHYNLAGLAFILRTAGCKDPAVPDAGTLRILFGVQVQRIVQMGHELATVVRERIVSTDFDVVAEAPGVPFDPATMDTVFGAKQRGGDEGGAAAAVVCTVELGLQCTTRAVAGEGTAQDVQMQCRLLVKPKVVLPSVLQTLREAS